MQGHCISIQKLTVVSNISISHMTVWRRVQAVERITHLKKLKIFITKPTKLPSGYVERMENSDGQLGGID